MAALKAALVATVVAAAAAAVAGAAVDAAADGAAGVAVLTALLDLQLASVRSRPQLSAKAREILMAERIGDRGRSVCCGRKSFATVSQLLHGIADVISAVILRTMRA